MGIQDGIDDRNRWTLLTPQVQRPMVEAAVMTAVFGNDIAAVRRLVYWRNENETIEEARSTELGNALVAAICQHSSRAIAGLKKMARGKIRLDDWESQKAYLHSISNRHAVSRGKLPEYFAAEELDEEILEAYISNGAVAPLSELCKNVQDPPFTVDHFSLVFEQGNVAMLDYLLKKFYDIDDFGTPTLFVPRAMRKWNLPAIYQLVTQLEFQPYQLPAMLNECIKSMGDWKEWSLDPNDTPTDNPAVRVVRDLVHRIKETHEDGIDEVNTLHDAARQAPLEVIKILIEEGDADVNAAESTGHQTPLMVALQQGRSREVIMLLLNAGADVNLMDSRGFDALSLAAKQREWDLLQLMRGK